MAPLGSLVGPRPLIGCYGQQHRLQLRERATYDPRACGSAVSTEPAAIESELVHTRTIVRTIDPVFANDGLDETRPRNLFLTPRCDKPAHPPHLPTPTPPPAPPTPHT